VSVEAVGAAPPRVEARPFWASLLCAHGAVAAVVALSFAGHWLLGLLEATPVYFPDEYVYASLARSLAHAGRPLVRGEAAHFPALLEPILAAPFSLVGGPQLAYRLTQGLNSLAGSLGAVPIYLLCRRLGLGGRFAVAAAALTVLRPGLFFSAFVLADPIAQPLVLGAIYAGVCVLTQPTRRNEVGFLALAALATLARLQYLPLPLLLVVCALVLEGGPLAALAVLVASPQQLLGYYGGVLDLSLRPRALAHWYVTELLLVTLATGVVLVPAALVGLARAIRREAPPAERSFAALTLAFAFLLLSEAALYASNGAGRYEGRYMSALTPLVVPAFGLYRKHGCRRRRTIVLLALLVLDGLLTIDLFGYTVGQAKAQSPLLIALYRLEDELAQPLAYLAVCGLVSALCLGAVVATVRRRWAAPAALTVNGAMAVAVLAGAVSFDHVASADAKAQLFPSGLGWVDRSGLRDIAVLNLPGTRSNAALMQLFWNERVTDVLRFPGAPGIDAFGSKQTTLVRDGTLLLAGRPLRRPLLVDDYADTIELTGAREVARSGSFRLWLPLRPARLRLYAAGRYWDGWLAPRATIATWPDRPSLLRLRVALPAPAPRTRVVVSYGGRRLSVPLAPGRAETLAVCVDRRSPSLVALAFTKPLQLADGRLVAARASAPTLRAAVCRAGRIRVSSNLGG
jgi:hypothetical protein